MRDKKRRGPRYFGSKTALGYIETGFDGKRYLLHRLYAESVIGKPLPPKSIVHHVNGDGTKQRSNIVICENQAYHVLLHTRKKALETCGNPNWRKCYYCQKYDDPENMVKANSFCSNLVHSKCRYEAKIRWLERKTDGKSTNESGITRHYTGRRSGLRYRSRQGSDGRGEENQDKP